MRSATRMLPTVTAATILGQDDTIADLDACTAPVAAFPASATLTRRPAARLVAIALDGQRVSSPSSSTGKVASWAAGRRVRRPARAS